MNGIAEFCAKYSLPLPEAMSAHILDRFGSRVAMMKYLAEFSSNFRYTKSDLTRFLNGERKRVTASVICIYKAVFPDFKL